MALMMSNPIDLKPFRSYSEHDVRNGLYSAQTIPLYKGTFVTIVQASGNPNVNTTGTGVAAPSPFISNLGPWGGAPDYVVSNRFGIGFNKVRAANSGEVVLGMNLVDCVEVNKYGENYASRSRNERLRDQVVLSGEGLKIVTRGIFTTKGFTGTPSANTGAYVNNGVLVPCPYNKATFPQLVGKFLEGADNDGYALFQIEL